MNAGHKIWTACDYKTTTEPQVPKMEEVWLEIESFCSQHMEPDKVAIASIENQDREGQYDGSVEAKLPHAPSKCDGLALLTCMFLPDLTAGCVWAQCCPVLAIRTLGSLGIFAGGDPVQSQSIVLCALCMQHAASLEWHLSINRHLHAPGRSLLTLWEFS